MAVAAHLSLSDLGTCMQAGELCLPVLWGGRSIKWVALHPFCCLDGEKQVNEIVQRQADTWALAAENDLPLLGLPPHLSKCLCAVFCALPIVS